ncbi:MAG: hypothetical protein V3S84_04395 [Dehalococcoidales bacterium]
MERTWKGTTAGILTLIGGCAGIAIGAVLTTLGAEFMAGMPGWELMAGIGAGLFAFGIIALIAGIFTLRRKSWRFALAGAILALFPIIPLGVLAIIFVSKSKSEFA